MSHQPDTRTDASRIFIGAKLVLLSKRGSKLRV
jgi:hypothetical protein